LKIVEPLIVETLERNPEWNPVDPDVLARTVARVKSGGITRNPNHLFFKIKLDKILENFFRGEVKVGRKRHLIFMTEEQMKCLKSTVRCVGFATQKNLVRPRIDSGIPNQNQESLKMTPEFKNDSRLEKKTLQLNYYA
jgi:hypothetical protein